MAGKPVDWAEQLRAAIAASGLAKAEIARRAGTTEATLSRFSAGKRGMTLAVAGRVGHVVGCRLVADSRASGG